MLSDISLFQLILESIALWKSPVDTYEMGVLIYGHKMRILLENVTAWQMLPRALTLPHQLASFSSDYLATFFRFNQRKQPSQHMVGVLIRWLIITMYP